MIVGTRRCFELGCVLFGTISDIPPTSANIPPTIGKILSGGDSVEGRKNGASKFCQKAPGNHRNQWFLEHPGVPVVLVEKTQKPRAKFFTPITNKVTSRMFSPHGMFICLFAFFKNQLYKKKGSKHSKIKNQAKTALHLDGRQKLKRTSLVRTSVLILC